MTMEIVRRNGAGMDIWNFTNFFSFDFQGISPKNASGDRKTNKTHLSGGGGVGGESLLKDLPLLPKVMISWCPRYQALSQPEWVHNRSIDCDIEWPQYSEISQSEQDFPLGENIVFSVSLRTRLKLFTNYILFSLCHH